MRRFFCPSRCISSDTIIINDKEQVHHARDVLRLKAGEKVIVFDEGGNEYECLLGQISGVIGLSIKNKSMNSLEKKGVKITVACAVAKKLKMDEVVDSLAQLGVERVIPLETQRVIVKFDKDNRVSRLARWRKIALNASQQSHRRTLMVVEPIKDMREFLQGLGGYDLKLIPTLVGKRKSLKEACANFNPGNILILIGPEGDFTPEELAKAIERGCIPVSLGDLVMRVETAAVAAASYIRLSL